MESGPDRSARPDVVGACADAAAPDGPGAASGDLAAIRSLLAQTPDERFLGLVRAARFFAAARRV
jgi:hypothetical protein